MWQESIKISCWATWYTNRSFGCFIKDGKHVVTDMTSGFLLQNRLCWLVGCFILTPIVVFTWRRLSWLECVYGTSKFFLKDHDIFSPTLTTKEGFVKCSNACCSKFLLIPEGYYMPFICYFWLNGLAMGFLELSQNAIQLEIISETKFCLFHGLLL